LIGDQERNGDLELLRRTKAKDQVSFEEFLKRNVDETHRKGVDLSIGGKKDQHQLKFQAELELAQERRTVPPSEAITTATRG